MNTTASDTTGAILVPVDFSEGSRHALRWACDLSARVGTPLLILHVVHDSDEDPGLYRRDEEGKVLHTLDDRAADMLERFVAEAKGACPDQAVSVAMRTRIVSGVPVNRILEVADEEGVGQVVMGSQGRTGLDRLLLGSKAEQVVRLARVPVTIVKPPPAEPGEDDR